MERKDPFEGALGALPEEMRATLRSALEQERAQGAESLADDGYQALRRRAALQGAFDPTSLVDLGTDDSRRSALLDRLISESTVTTREGRRLWMLRDGARRQVLRGMTREQIRQELTTHTPQVADELTRTLHELLVGAAPPLEEQTPDQLMRTYVVSEWLEGSSVDAPSPIKVQDVLGFAQLLKPFDELLRRGFAGRDKELRQLRDYVGVQPPERWVGWGRRGLKAVARRLSSWRSYMPFVVHGPGGVGKSTLMASFLAEHARQNEDRRFPFAYLDFDRAALMSRQPISLLLEIAEQVSHQFPHLRAALRAYADQQRGRVQRRLREYRRSSESAEASTGALESIGRDPELIGAAASALRKILDEFRREGRPFLVVLDTFEEVQHAGDQDVEEVLSMLQRLSDDGEWGSLRVVASGRAPLEEMAGAIALGPLRPDDAVDVLRKLVSAPTHLLRQIAEHVGGHPLALHLASEVVRRELRSGGVDASLVNLLATERTLLDRVLGQYDVERITVSLQQRILDHIHDDDVRKLAHPGLILRKVTPRLIEAVLAEPCGLGRVSSEQARSLFERLAQEVALVQRDGDVLVHRRDVRALMLPMIRADLEATESGAFQAINRRAIELYDASSADEDRAEAIYHRLLLDDVGAAFETWSPGAERFLKTAADDLPARARAFLKAQLGLALEESEAATLQDSVWARWVERRAVRHLQTGAPESARALLTSRGYEQLRGRHVALLARAQHELAELEDAARWYERALEEPETREDVQVVRAAAELLLRLDRPDAERAFRAAIHVAGERPDRILHLELLTGVLGATLRSGRSEPWLVQQVVERARDRGRLLPARAPGLLRRVVLFCGAEAEDLFAEYFRAAPLVSVNEREHALLTSVVNEAESAPAQARWLLAAAGDSLRDDAGRPFVLDEEHRHLADPMNAWLQQQAREGGPRVQAPLRALLVTRHPDWHMPCRGALARLPEGALRALREELLPPAEKLGSKRRLSPARQAHALVEAADERGVLVDLMRKAARAEESDSVISSFAEVFWRWDEFLHSLLSAPPPFEVAT